MLSVRGEGDFSLRERWLAFTFPDKGFAPVRVRGHRGGKWETHRGRVEVIHQPAPALRQDAVLRRTGGKLLKFDAIDLHTEALHHAYDIKHPGPAPYECRLVGYLGGWRASGGELLLPQDLALTGPTCAGATQFLVPIRCLDGAVATGYDGGQFVTESGPKATLVGPIPPRASTSEARIRAVLSRVPEGLKLVTHREGVTRHIGVTSAEAATELGVALPPELLYLLPHGAVCPVGAFLRWFVGFTADDVAVVHPPDFVDYRPRLDSLVARMDQRTRRLWHATQAGDAAARRRLADCVQKQGDRGRAALLRRR